LSFKIIAHRGASGISPENTLSAIEKAISLHVDYVEIDIRLSLDNIPVVIHDPSLRRTTGLREAPFVHRSTLAEIKRWDVGKAFDNIFAGQTVPTLEEVLQLPWKNTGLMIEIKNCPQPEKQLVEAIFHTISAVPSLPPLVIGSFSPEIVKWISKFRSEKLQMIRPIAIIEKQEMIEVFLSLGLKHIALWYKLISPPLVDFFREKEIEVWVFTVNHIREARFLYSLGIEGIISNYPDKISKQLKETI
jgi:glycerophosphoryl diester phosphodiesterase